MGKVSIAAWSRYMALFSAFGNVLLVSPFSVVLMPTRRNTKCQHTLQRCGLAASSACSTRCRASPSTQCKIGGVGRLVSANVIMVASVIGVLVQAFEYPVPFVKFTGALRDVLYIRAVAYIMYASFNLCVLTAPRARVVCTA